MWKSIGCGIFVIWLLTGCGKTALTQADVDLSARAQDAQVACYKAKKLDLSKVPETAIGYVVISKAFSDAMLAMAGKEPCQSTNAFDVQVAEIRNQDSALDWVVGIGGIATPWIPYILGGKKNTKSSMTAGGDIYYGSTRADSTSAYQSSTSDLFTSGTSTATDSTHWTSEHTNGTE